MSAPESTPSRPGPLKVTFKVNRPPPTSNAPQISPIQPAHPTSPGSTNLNTPLLNINVASPSTGTPNVAAKPNRIVFRTSSTPASEEPPKPAKIIFKTTAKSFEDMNPVSSPIDEDMYHDSRNRKRERSESTHDLSTPSAKRKPINQREYDFPMSPTSPQNMITIDDDYSELRSGATSYGSGTSVTTKKYVPLRKALNNALKKLIDLDSYKFFYEPVREEDAPGYHAAIKSPMDFSTMKKKLNEDKYPYWSLFTSDFELICQNCISFNAPETIYWNEAKTLLLEGRKYLKTQGTKINPDQLKPPDNWSASSLNTTDASGTANSGASAALDAQRDFLAMLEPPKRVYVKNDELPARLLAPPPPVSILTPPSTASKVIYPPSLEAVAQGTPQQQNLSKPVGYPLFTVGPTNSSYYGKAIPAYINYTRGYPEGKPFLLPGTRDLVVYPPPVNEKTPESLNARWLYQQQLFYLKSVHLMDHKKYASSLLKFVDGMSDAAKDRCSALIEYLKVGSNLETEERISPTLAGAKDLMDIDSDSVLIDPSNPFQMKAEQAAEVKTLKSTLAATHLDLSFLDSIIQVVPDTKYSTLNTINSLLDRNYQLIDELNPSTQSWKVGGIVNDQDRSLLTEFAANLTTLASLISPSQLSENRSYIDQMKIAVELGLPGIPLAKLKSEPIV